MVKKAVLLIGFFILVRGLYGQEQTLQTFYAQNSMTINPANTGIQAKGSVYLWHRSQWLNFDGGPSTQMLSFEYPLAHSSFGANLMHDQIGPYAESSFTGYYSYVFNINFDIQMSMGISAGITNYNYDPSKINIKDPGESYLENSQNFMYFKSGVGFTVFSDKWHVGISSPSLIPPKSLSGNTASLPPFIPSVYFNAGGTIPINYNIYMQPSVLMRYNSQLPFSIETNFMFLFYDKFVFGLSYRLKAAYATMIGYHISKNFKIGYAFDLDANPIRKYNAGSHEVFLKYTFETRQGNVRFQSPRFF